MEWVARRGRRADGKEQARRIPVPQWRDNEQATQPAALLPRALQGCVDFGPESVRGCSAWPRSLRISAMPVRLGPLRALASTKIHSNAAHSSFPTVSREINMSDIITERSGNILRIQLNRPAKKNAMTSAMYITLADLFNAAAKDDQIRVVLWHGAGDSFSAGNDIQDFLKNPPGPGKSPQAELIDALINFDKPIVAAVQGAAIGGGTTVLTHCDFVFAGETAKFRMPFVDLAVVPEFGTSYSVPARMGYLRAAELILLGITFDAKRAAELGLVTRVVADQQLLPTATAAGQQLAVKPPGALQSCKRLMRSSTRELLERAVKLENEEFSVRVRSAEAKEAFTAFIEKRRPDFTKTNERANPKAQAA